MKTTIYGAGLAGLIAASQFQTAEVVEFNKKEHINHKALLRFRTPEVGNALGIPFRKVKVRKGIYYNGEFREPNIMLANSYAQKVTGKTIDRSIWNLDSVERYIAPEDLIPQLIERYEHRISFETKVDAARIEKDRKDRGNIVSTIPLNVMLEMCGSTIRSDVVFNRKRINVERYRLKDCDVHQTIYFPCHENFNPVYRASITGDLLIIEYVDYAHKFDNYLNQKHLIEVIDAFNVSLMGAEKLDTVSQSHGKIVDIDSAWRKYAIYKLSTQMRIFSLGRFGTWRNILLDDVLSDVAVIRKLMGGSTYELAKENSK